jgi:hypothetical protein
MPIVRINVNTGLPPTVWPLQRNMSRTMHEDDNLSLSILLELCWAYGVAANAMPR